MALDNVALIPVSHRKNFFDLPETLRDKIVPPFDMDAPVPLRIKLLVSPEKNRALDAAMLHQKNSPENYPNILKAEREANVYADRREAGAVAPPTTNRGGKSTFDDSLPSFQVLELCRLVSAGKKGKFDQIRIPRPDRFVSSSISFIDWVNFTFKKSDIDLMLNTGHAALSDDDFVTAFSSVLYEIFGFGITAKRPSGMNFYAASHDIGYHGWGLLCIGGQRDSVLVTIKGQGLMASKSGWEQRLYEWMRQYKSAKLTRVDFASDSFASSVSLDDYLEMYRAGLFANSGRPPEVECVGNWEKPSGKGRTLYIGGRTSGKLLRIYEKGLQLAGGFHERFPKWVRVELELKNTDRIIPLDSLLKPGQYLAGAYPALKNLCNQQVRIETHKKTVESTVEKSLEVTRHQFGKHIWMHVQLMGLDEAIKALTKGKEELPPKINADTHLNFIESDYVHTQTTQTITLEDIPL